MYGAIIGDIAGSKYEFNPIKDKNFTLLTDGCRITDDSVMTVAVAETQMSLKGDESDDEIKKAFALEMKKWGRKYPNAGYGENFAVWLGLDDMVPYNSFGNGSAMRVSSCAWLYDDLAKVREMARLSSEVTHNHPEGIKGAEAIASAIFMARIKIRKDEIRSYIVSEFGYDLERSCEEIRKDYTFDVTCQGSVPEAIIAFLEGSSYEDVIREAISLGGDADTQAAISGSIAEAYYGIPVELIDESKKYIPGDVLGVAEKFYSLVSQRM